MSDVVLTHPVPDSQCPVCVAVWILEALNLFSHSGCEAVPSILNVVFTSQVLDHEVSDDAFVPTVVEKFSLLWARLPIMCVILAELCENLVLQVSLIRVKIVLEELGQPLREKLVILVQGNVPWIVEAIIDSSVQDDVSNKVCEVLHGDDVRMDGLGEGDPV